MSATRECSLTVNGREVTVRVEDRRTLADLLRLDLGLTGTKLGCEHGVCGACTVLLDGRAIRSCLCLAVQAEGGHVETVESLAEADGALDDLQEAFRTHHALQCGFCTAGILMSLTERSREGALPADEAGVREALAGNLCRCTGYQGIVDAVLSLRAQAPGAAQEGPSDGG